MQRSITARYDNQGPWWLFGLASFVFFCFAVHYIVNIIQGNMVSLGDFLVCVLFSLGTFTGCLLTRPATFEVTIGGNRATGRRKLFGRWDLTSSAELNPASRIVCSQGGSVPVNMGSFLSNAGGHVFIINGAVRNKFFTNVRSAEECRKVIDILESAIHHQA